MQHGSILLAQSEYTPLLPGLLELTGLTLSAFQVREAITQSFAKDTGWHTATGGWTDLESGPSSNSSRNDMEARNGMKNAKPLANWLYSASPQAARKSASGRRAPEADVGMGLGRLRRDRGDRHR